MPPRCNRSTALPTSTQRKLGHAARTSSLPMRTSQSTAAGALFTRARTTALASTTALDAVAVIPILADELCRIEGALGNGTDLRPKVEHALPPVGILLPTLGLTFQDDKHLGVHRAPHPFRPALDLLVELGRNVPDVQRGHGAHASTLQALSSKDEQRPRSARRSSPARRRRLLRPAAARRRAHGARPRDWELWSRRARRAGRARRGLRAGGR